jgi:glyoxylase-like metal-dependent hydrolase (beta-lactamase superfamily II)
MADAGPVELVTRVVGPLATNVLILGDRVSHEAIAIDTAIPSLEVVRDELAARGWTLRLIVSTHGHWDHMGDNAALSAQTGASIAVHPLDAHRLTHPKPLFAPFPIPPCVPAVDLAEGGVIRFGSIRLEVLHTPGHTEGSVCLLAATDGLLITGDTMFAGGWGRVDFPGGSAGQMVESLTRLSRYEDDLVIMPGHGPSGTIGQTRPWLDAVVRERRLPG